MYRAFTATLTALLVVAAARASPYWIEYEPGNGHFPEEEGWTRIWGDDQGPYHGDGAHRWIEDGALVIDSLESIHIVDFYQCQLGGQLDPGPGELFVLNWRLKVDDVVGSHDPGVGVFSDQKWAVGFRFSETALDSAFEPDVSASFEPGIFHEFELRSADMLAYDLFIDGQLTIQGSFWLSLTPSRVGWGDFIQGAASLSQWDYLDFGVIPEPSTSLSLFALAPCLGSLGRRVSQIARARKQSRNYLHGKVLK